MNPPRTKAQKETMMTEPVAVLCSDIHLSETPPIARSGENDWFGAMVRYLIELKDLSEDLEVPILCGGDVFHKWKSSPELINFAIKYLPTMYSVAGQHDLPYHNLDEMEKSAFKTLCLIGDIYYLPDIKCTQIGKVRVFGFSWGEDIKPPPSSSSDTLNVLVAHKYFWVRDQKFPGASDKDNVLQNADLFRGYDVALLGDNHKSWSHFLEDKCLVYNPGSFMRRNSNQVDHKPQAGILHDDGEITTHYLDVSKDRFDTTEKKKKEVEEDEFNMDEFVDELQGLGEAGLNFVEAIKKVMDREGVRKSVRKIVLKALGEDK